MNTSYTLIKDRSRYTSLYAKETVCSKSKHTLKFYNGNVIYNLWEIDLGINVKSGQTNRILKGVINYSIYLVVIFIKYKRICNIKMINIKIISF